MTLTTISIVIGIIISVAALITQIIAVGIYIGKLEGFKEIMNFRMSEQDKRFELKLNGLKNLVDSKFEDQNKRLDKHNNFITRVYELEKRDQVENEQIKVANRRIEDLENTLNKR